MFSLRIAAQFLTAFSLCAAASPDTEKRVDEFFRPVAGGKSPGAAVAVVRDGQVVFLKAYGMADDAGAIPNSAGTIFRLASVTKTFTAVAVLQLVEGGKLKLDDPLSKYVPDFPNADKIRISHLLSHTAGVPDFIPYDEVKKRSLEFEPGSRINYSNNGYYVLGRVIEKVSGQPWDEYLRDHIFLPLGMKHSGYDRTPELAGRATGYLAGADGNYQPIAPQDALGGYAGGGLYSTVEDLVLWAGGLTSDKLLRKETLERASTPGLLTDGRRTAYGFGWMTASYRGLREVGHGGDITGFNTYFARYPDEKLTVIVLSNVGMRPPGPLPVSADLVHRIAEVWLEGRMQKPDVAPDVKVDPATLQSYTGRYRLDAPEVMIQNMGSHIVITQQGDHLVAEANGMKLPLLAKSDTVFQASGSPAELTFVCGGSGRCPKIVITLMGLREFPALREQQ
jgi:CubicO group peptidase (beta-lactamase class C family)